MLRAAPASRKGQRSRHSAWIGRNYADDESIEIDDRPNGRQRAFSPLLHVFLNGFGEKSVLGSIEEPEKYTEVVGAGLAQVVQEACAAIGSPK